MFTEKNTRLILNISGIITCESRPARNPRKVVLSIPGLERKGDKQACGWTVVYGAAVVAV